jgi:hypothetical protein
VKDETYQARYKTGKTSIAVSFLFALASLLFVLFCIISGSNILALSIIIFLFAAGAVFLLIRSYREIRLYQNRMEVVGVIDGIIVEIYYKDIANIGFANGRTDYGTRNTITGKKTNSVPISELVILLHNRDRHMFGDDDYDHLPEACAFIQDRMARLQ